MSLYDGNISMQPQFNQFVCDGDGSEAIANSTTGQPRPRERCGQSCCRTVLHAAATGRFAVSHRDFAVKLTESETEEAAGTLYEAGREGSWGEPRPTTKKGYRTLVTALAEELLIPHNEGSVS
jgi:hypothetical protein